MTTPRKRNLAAQIAPSTREAMLDFLAATADVIVQNRVLLEVQSNCISRQTKLGSFAEAWANIGVGFGVNFFANLIVLPWFGLQVTPGKAFGIGIIFTAISLVRSYVLRRWFNGLKFGNTEAAR